MKKLLLLLLPLLVIALVILSGFARLEDHFFYAFDEKIQLEKMEHKIVIGYSEGMDKNAIGAFVHAMSKEIVSLEFADEHTTIVEISNADNVQTILEKAKDNENVKFIYPVFRQQMGIKYQTGLEMALSDEIVIKFKSGVSETVIDSINSYHGLELIQKTKLHNLYRVTEGNPLQIANLYQEGGLVEFSHPNFISKITLHQQSIPNDPYFSNQFYLNNTGQTFNGHTGKMDADIDAPEAWAITEGDNDIIVAVLDEGVTSNHVDLPNTRQLRLPGSNFSGTGSVNDPSPNGNGNHGNACAGIIGATRNNNIGISGVAPKVRIMPIKISGLNGFATPNNIANALTFAVNNGADVISNSWAAGSNNPNHFPVIVNAIQNAVTTGRNNLGCVMVFAAGNNAHHANGTNGFVEFPANVNIPGVLSVGATDRYDLQANYSPTSSLIDICAPSHRAYPAQISGETFEVWTIDIPGNAGYNPWPSTGVHPPATAEALPSTGTNHLDFTGRFGGTSAACPQVAAVAALMLSVNPNLTQQQVFNFITASADKVGGVSYPGGKNNQYGYGRLNAFEAVYAAIPKLNVTVNGPGYLSYCDQGNWNSTVSSGNGNYTYKWYVTETGYDTVPPVTSLVGTGSTYTTYMDYHTNPPNTNSFILRLYVTDSNGKFGRGSKTVYGGDPNDLCGSIFTIYPNPANTTLNVAFTKEINSDGKQNIKLPYQISLYGANSLKPLHSVSYETIKMNNNMAVFNISNYAPGTYFVHLQYPDQMVKRQVIIY